MMPWAPRSSMITRSAIPKIDASSCDTTTSVVPKLSRTCNTSSSSLREVIVEGRGPSRTVAHIRVTAALPDVDQDDSETYPLDILPLLASVCIILSLVEEFAIWR